LGRFGKYLKTKLSLMASSWSSRETKENKKEIPEDNLILPHWVQNVVSPWVKRSNRKERARAKNVTISTMPVMHEASMEFWKKKGYNVRPFDKIPMINRNRNTVLVTSAPTGDKERIDFFNKVLPKQNRFAVFATIDEIHQATTQKVAGLQIIFINRPVRLLQASNDSNSVKASQNDASHHQQFAWMTKGLNLPHAVMWSDGAGQVTNNGGTSCWNYVRDKLSCVKTPDDGAKRILFIKPHSNEQCEIEKLLLSTNEKEAEHGFEKLTTLLRTGPSEELKPVGIIKLLNIAFKHLESPIKKNGKYHCKCCSRSSLTTTTPCVVSVMAICNEIAKNNEYQCGIRRMALAQIEKCLNDSLNPHQIGIIVRDGLLAQTLKPLSSERRSWLTACQLTRRLLVGCAYQSVWSALTNELSQIETPQQRVLAFVKRALKEDSEHFIDDDTMAMNNVSS
jgi:hypothetical protein